MNKTLSALGFHERDVDVDGVRLHLCEGPKSGPPVVLVPGQSMPWDSYQKLMPLLARDHHVIAVDVRGHGESEHTPGRYTFGTCGRDLWRLLETLEVPPAVVCGNSSGGLIGLWVAAEHPARVRALVLEDPPLFSSEWPRMRDDLWASQLFRAIRDTLAKPGPRDIAAVFRDLKIPTQDGKKLMSFPRPLAWVLHRAIRRRQQRAPGQPIDIAWLPLHVRLFVRGLSEYDPDFTVACTDGRICDIDHAALLAKVRCPGVLLQADSFRHPTLGLVGAMDDDDAARAIALAPSLTLERWPSTHVMHLHSPKRYAEVVRRFTHPS
jgi:pimeloyl-ACP methyl ester carboxylesterase